MWSTVLLVTMFSETPRFNRSDKTLSLRINFKFVSEYNNAADLEYTSLCVDFYSFQI